MSFKSKDLVYESGEPSFLRKLRGEYGGGGSGPDGRHERPRARPVKPSDGDEDDGPTYVDGDTNQTISKEEYERMADPNSVKAGIEGDNLSGTAEAAANPDAAEGESEAGKKTSAAIGGANKRRIGKVVGANEDDEETKGETKKEAVEKKKATKKPGKKAKKIKLSFDEE